MRPAVFPLVSALIALCADASAQSVVTHVIPVPPDVLQNQILFGTMVGPPDGTVVDVRAHMEFTPAGTFTADDVLIELGAPVLPSFPDWMLIGGPDFGWGTGNGTFVGNAKTSSLNGEMSTGPFGGTVWNLMIDAAPGSGHSGVTGQFTDSFYEIDYVPADLIGKVYCSSNPNSSGETGEIYATGSDAVADDDVTLHAHKLPVGENGYFLMSDVQGFVPLFGGSEGNLCLGGQIRRFANDVLSVGAMGDVLLELDLSDLPQGTTILPGETWSFQFWFRDVDVVQTSNTSNALEIMFL